VSQKGQQRRSLSCHDATRCVLDFVTLIETNDAAKRICDVIA
jgi:hypothetical protein